jgi:sporulation protein YlmC with PRC-barrel domain
LSGRKARGLEAVGSRPKFRREKAALPRRFQLEDDGTATRISWRWFRPSHLALAGFCVVWDGFLLVWYTIALSRSEWLMVVFPVLHVLAGLGLTYSTLAGFLNRTHIEVRRDELTIRHGPLPWRGNQTLSRRSLTQLYGEEIIQRSKGQRTGTVYNLMALDREGRKVKLLTDLAEKEQVLYLEQALERRLGIEDAPVEGEVAVRTQVG